MAELLIFMTMATITATAANSWTEDWKDEKRDRTVPVRIFLPDGAKQPGPYPVVLLSHGLGGSREGFGYLGEDWSAHGYVVVVMQHVGSDISIHLNREKSRETPQQRMLNAVSAEKARDRYDDARFVLDELERRNASKDPKERLAGKIDLERIGFGGHSFGSQTTLAVVGRFPYKAEPRIKAAVAMSPNRTKTGDQAHIHAPIKAPVMHLIGTKDGSPLERDFNPSDRRIPFDSMAAPERYLVNFEGGTHMLFSGHRRPFGLTNLEKRYQPLIAEMTRKFWDAYLKGDAEAKQWLKGKGLDDMMNGNGTVERK